MSKKEQKVFFKLIIVEKSVLNKQQHFKFTKLWEYLNVFLAAQNKIKWLIITPHILQPLELALFS
jgi:hypothetical protein